MKRIVYFLGGVGLVLCVLFAWREVTRAAESNSADKPTRAELEESQVRPSAIATDNSQGERDTGGPRTIAGQPEDRVAGDGFSTGSKNVKGTHPSKPEPPPEIARLLEIRSVLQTINRVVYSWKEYEFETSQGKRYIAIELLLPEKKKLSPREGWSLLQASRKVVGGPPNPGQGIAIPPSQLPDLKAVEPFYEPDKAKGPPPGRSPNAPDREIRHGGRDDAAPDK